MDKEIEVRIQKEPWSQGISVLLKHDNSVAKSSNIIFTPHNIAMVVEPSFRMQSNSAQQLMDDLWMAGFRPSEGSGSAGSLLATEKHLSDMRDIAFHSLNVTRKTK